MTNFEIKVHMDVEVKSSYDSLRFAMRTYSHMKKLTVLGLFWAAISGCSDTSGVLPQEGTTPTPSPPSMPLPTPTPPPSLYCEELQSEAITLEEVTPLGFSAQDVLDHVIRDFQGSLTYHGPYPSTIIELSPAYENGQARFVTVDSQSQPGDGSSCSDRLEIPLNYQVRTVDGHLDEPFVASLRATLSDFAGFYIELDADTLQGTFAFADFDPREYDERTLEIRSEILSGAFRGTIHGRGDAYEEGQSPARKFTPTPTPLVAPYTIRSLFMDWADQP